MGEEADVLKFLRRRTKDLTMTPGFWNFLITLVTIVALIFYFGGAPNTKNFRQREKVVGQWNIFTSSRRSFWSWSQGEHTESDGCSDPDGYSWGERGC